MGRIDRYVTGSLVAVFGLASLVLVLVYWINRAVVLFDQLIADGQSAWVFLEFTALALPSIVKLVLPLAAFVATLIVVNRLSTGSELAAMQATGLSPWRLARPVLGFGLLVAALVSVLAHALGPLSAQRLGTRTSEIAETATARLLREGEFTSPAAGLTLYVREVTPEGELRDLLLSDSHDVLAPVTYTAAQAFLVRGPAGPQIVMIDGLIQRLDRVDGRLAVTSFGDLAYDVGPLLGADGRAGRRAREVPTWELWAPTPALVAEVGEDAPALRAEAHERLAEALVGPVAALIALGALLVAPHSRMGVWRHVGGAVVLVIVVKGVESAAVQALREDPGLWLLAYLPALVGLGMAGALLAWAAGSRPAWRRVAA